MRLANTVRTKGDIEDSRRYPVGLGALAVIVSTLFFFLLFWNRFLGIRSGDGEYGGGMAFLAGLMPYRDYFTASTPLNIFKSAAILSLFGQTLIAVRAFAVFERALMALVLCFWLRRLFRTPHAVLGAVVAIILSAGDIADPLCSYNHDAIFLAMLSGFLASFALDQFRGLRPVAFLAMTSGIFACLSFLTKQTIGLGASAVTPVVVAAVLLRLDGRRRAAIWAGAFLLGWAVPAGVFLLWLSHLGILDNFLSMVFVKGPAAKAAHPGDFLLRTLFVLRSIYLRNAFLGLLALILSWTALRRSGAKEHEQLRSEETESGVTRDTLAVFAITLGAILLGILASYSFHLSAGNMDKLWVYYVEFGLFALLMEYSIRCFRGNLTRRQGQFALLATVSLVLALMLSLSWPIFEAMLIPGLGFLTAASLDGTRPRFRLLIYAVAVLAIAAETRYKLEVPFGFGTLYDPPVRIAHSTSTLPQLRGLLLPQSTVDFVDGTVNIISAHSTAQDTIFTYPEIGVLYSLSARTSPTLAGSHNIDVINDQFAREEAMRLLNARPAVIIYRHQEESELLSDELVWRHGNRSGQRDIIAAIESLIKDYKLVASYKIGDSPVPILVYVRK